MHIVNFFTLVPGEDTGFNLLLHHTCKVVFAIVLNSQLSYLDYGNCMVAFCGLLGGLVIKLYCKLQDENRKVVSFFAIWGAKLARVCFNNIQKGEVLCLLYKMLFCV